MNTNLQTELVITQPSVTTQGLIFDPTTIRTMQSMAEAMASARIAIPKHLAGSPGDCLAIVMQAAQWRMNPFAVAQKTHVVNGVLGYEAQLVNAVVSSSALLATRIGYAWEGDWRGVNGKTDKSDERACTVSATLIGESTPRPLRVSMAQVGDVRNSPLWVSDPRQQLAYLATKRWARLHAPDVLLGVYTVDELHEPPERAMGQAHVVADSPADSRTADVKARLRQRTAAPIAPPQDPGPDLAEVLRRIAEAESPQGLQSVAELAAKLTDEDAKAEARTAFAARRDALITPDSPLAWPQSDPETGELRDIRGCPWIEAAHSANRTCNETGEWRRKRGVDPEVAERLERDATADTAEDATEPQDHTEKAL
ncbi:RecT family recombinase [uncultured Thiodictyon sp.]|uniref:RecT family recombinase n=1 Tax=uncultured Thiodictyon sp. TaxID=1846217 RepID=UPI0025CBF05C|nr:RecT family recombinase [uncultured Thiodictyon sp.]